MPIKSINSILIFNTTRFLYDQKYFFMFLQIVAITLIYTLKILVLWSPKAPVVTVAWMTAGKPWENINFKEWEEFNSFGYGYQKLFVYVWTRNMDFWFNERKAIRTCRCFLWPISNAYLEMNEATGEVLFVWWISKRNLAVLTWMSDFHMQ